MMDPLVGQEYLPELLNERMKGFFYALKEYTEYQAYVTTPSMASKGTPITQHTDLGKIDFIPMLSQKNSTAGPRLSKTLHLYDEGVAQNFFQAKQDLIIVIVSTKDDTHWSMPQVLGPLRETWPADLKTLMDLKDKLKQTEHSLRLITFVPHGNCLHKWQIASRLMYASSLNYFGDIKGDEWKESADSVDLCSLDFQQFFISLNEEIKYRD